MSRGRVASAMGAGCIAIVLAACAGGGAPQPAAPSSAAGAAPQSVAPSSAAPAAPIALRVRPIALPGAPDRVTMDYLAYDPATKILWVPAGNTKRVDTIDTTTGAVAEITGFATAQREARGVIRYLGPSSATVGAGGVVFVGNRGDSTVCALQSSARTRIGCVQLLAVPDGIAFIAPTKEVWVTTPREKAL